MVSVSTRVLKDQLSSYLHRAEGGERILVTRDGEVVAAIVPIADLPRETEAEILQRLAASGAVTLPTRPQSFAGPVTSGGPSASEMILQDRR